MGRSFPPEPSSVPAVRSFVRSQCPLLPLPVLEDLSVIVSELATNAVQHSGTSFEVDVEIHGSAVLLEVADGGIGNPIMGARPPLAAAGGRGLRIVDSLADEWGVRPAPGGSGKTVWAFLSAP